MEAITLTREDYNQALVHIDEACAEGSYLGRFKVRLLNGINTASTLEICRAIQSPDTETKVRLMRLCIKGRNVEVECPNGDIEKFCLGSENDNLEGFPLFQKEPLALLAISDCIYGYILKKYVRSSKPEEQTAAKQA